MSAAFFQIPKTAIFNEQKAQGFLPVRSPYSDPKIYMEPPPLRGYKHAPRNIKIFSGGIGPPLRVAARPLGIRAIYTQGDFCASCIVYRAAAFSEQLLHSMESSPSAELPEAQHRTRAALRIDTA